MLRWGTAALFAVLLILITSTRIESPGAQPVGINVEPVVWQFNQDYPGANARDSQLPVNTIYIKTHDGINWMSKWDTNPAAISGPDRLRQVVDYYRSHGIDVVAWFVPKGGEIEAQVAMANAVIDTGVRGLYADIEPYPGFCDLDCWWLSQTFWARVRAERPNASLGVIYDPRPWWWTPSGINGWISQADVALPMCYWDVFVDQPPWNNPAGCVTFAHSDLPFLGPTRPIQYIPMVQGDSTPEKLLASVQAAQSVGATSVSIWRRGVMTGETWDALRTVVAPRPDPQTQPDVAPPWEPPCVNDGCVLNSIDGTRKWVVYAGAKFPVDEELAHAVAANPGQVAAPEMLVTVPDMPADGTVFRTIEADSSYVVSGGALFPVDLESIPAVPVVAPAAVLEQIPAMARNGTLLKEAGEETIYIAAGGALYPLDPPLFRGLGLREYNINHVCDGGLARLPVVPDAATILRGLNIHRYVPEWGRFDLDPDPTLPLSDVLWRLASAAPPSARDHTAELPGCSEG